MSIEAKCRECGSLCEASSPLKDIDWNGEAFRQGLFYCENCDEEFAARVSVGTIYVNLYLVDRAYGGPEEGGWYYDYGIPEASIPVKTWAEANREEGRLLSLPEFSNEGRPEIWSVNSQGQYEVYFEDSVAKEFPRMKPHYE